MSIEESIISGVITGIGAGFGTAIGIYLANKLLIEHAKRIEKKTKKKGIVRRMKEVIQQVEEWFWVRT